MSAERRQRNLSVRAEQFIPHLCGRSEISAQQFVDIKGTHAKLKNNNNKTFYGLIIAGSDLTSLIGFS
jgi:hypothetical protein